MISVCLSSGKTVDCLEKCTVARQLCNTVLLILYYSYKVFGTERSLFFRLKKFIKVVNWTWCEFLTTRCTMWSHLWKVNTTWASFTGRHALWLAVIEYMHFSELRCKSDTGCIWWLRIQISQIKKKIKIKGRLLFISCQLAENLVGSSCARLHVARRIKGKLILIWSDCNQRSRLTLFWHTKWSAFMVYADQEVDSSLMRSLTINTFQFSDKCFELLNRSKFDH